MLALNACQTTQPRANTPANPTSIENHATQIQRIKQFSLESKIAIQHAGKGHSGRLQWQHAPASDHIQVLSPLGQVVAEIDRTPLSATLIDQQQKRHTADTVEQLTERTLGWFLPLSSLPFWVLGLAQPEHPSQPTYDAEGRLVQLIQDGWLITFQDYRDSAQTQAQADASLSDTRYALPYHLDLQRIAEPANSQMRDLKLKLRIVQWQLQSP